jgi:hypothetical protein
MDKQEFSATYLLLRAKSMPEAYNTSPPSIAPGGSTSEMWIPNCFKASRMASSSRCREAAPWHKFSIGSSVPQINHDPNVPATPKPPSSNQQMQNSTKRPYRMRGQCSVANHHRRVFNERAVRVLVISWQLNDLLHQACQTTLQFPLQAHTSR